MFGSAHVELLRRASKVRENVYLIVGVWGEQVSNYDAVRNRLLKNWIYRMCGMIVESALC